MPYLSSYLCGKYFSTKIFTVLHQSKKNYQIWIKIEQTVGLYFSKLGNPLFQWMDSHIVQWTVWLGSLLQIFPTTFCFVWQSWTAANPNALSNYVKCKIEARSCLKEALEYIGSIFGIFKCFLHSKENLAIDAD